MFDVEPQPAVYMDGDRRRPLPYGWRWRRLGDVILEAQPGFASGERDAQGILQLRMNNVDTRGNIVWDREIRVPGDQQSMARYLLVPGDVLFNNTNSTALVGKSALYQSHNEPVVFSNHFTRLRPVSAVLESAYLANWLLVEWQAQTFERLCNQWVGQSAVKNDKLLALSIPLPPLTEQRRIAAILAERMAAVERARAAAEAQLAALLQLAHAYVRQSLESADVQCIRVCESTVEVTTGIGSSWADYRLVGATRAGIAPAKEGVGKQPERYKLVEPGTIFYNPMRILLGSIALIDDREEPGITSPDYVVFRPVPGVLHPVWFYHWLRSPDGEAFIKALARGAVRERLLYRRLAPAEIDVPPWTAQIAIAEKLRSITHLKMGLTAQLDAINALPAALLRQAFSGELTLDMQQERRQRRMRREARRAFTRSQQAKKRIVLVRIQWPRAIGPGRKGAYAPFAQPPSMRSSARRQYRLKRLRP